MSEETKTQELDLINDVSEEQLRDEELVEDVEAEHEEESVTELDEAAEKSDEPNAGEVKKAIDAAPTATLPKTKAGMVNAMYKEMSKMKKEQLMAAYKKVMEMDDEDDDDDDDDDMEEMKSKKKMKEDFDFSSDLNALVESEATLSEGFQEKAAVIFEAAIKSKLSEEIDRLEEQYTTELEESTKQTREELVEKVDGYLNYVVEKWMEENELAVETGLRAEIAESFMESLKSVFTEHYIDVPESKVDLVDDLSGQVEELEEQLNKSIEENMKLNESVEEFTRDKVISEASRDLASTEAERLKTLVEDIDFEDSETFAKKVETVKQSYFSKTVTEATDEVETAIDENGDEVEVSPIMSKYVTALSRTLK